MSFSLMVAAMSLQENTHELSLNYERTKWHPFSESVWSFDFPIATFNSLIIRRSEWMCSFKPFVFRALNPHFSHIVKKSFSADKIEEFFSKSFKYFIYNDSYVFLKTDSLRADHCRSSMLANSFAERCLSMLLRCFKFGTRLRYVLGQHISLVEFMHSVQSLKTWRKMYSLWKLWLSSKISNIYWNM